MNELTYLKNLMDMDLDWSELISIKKKLLASGKLTQEQSKRCIEQIIKLQFEKEDMRTEMIQLANPFVSIPLKSLLCQSKK
jgi:hypothetical protein